MPLSSAAAPPTAAAAPVHLPAMQPMTAAEQAGGGGAVAGRRKKVIRSRIGYARGAAAADAASLAAVLTQGGGPAAAPSAHVAPSAPPPALTPTLARRASEASSLQSEGDGSYSPTAAADADSRPGSCSSQAASHASQGQEPGQAQRVSRQGSLAGGSEGAVGDSRQQHHRVEVGPAGFAGDPQHLTALQQHVAQLDIRLELPPRRSSDSVDAAPARETRSGSTGAWEV